MSSILIGCEYSRTVASAFEVQGHEVLSCDILPAEQPGAHYQGDVFDVIDYPWDFGGFHFPCTHSSVSGARHFSAKKLTGQYYAGNALWLKGWKASRHIPHGYFEHPVSVIASLFRKPDLILQPWMFGTFESKATCLWTWGLPPLVPKYKSPAECAEALGLPTDSKPHARIWLMPPSEERGKMRSVSYPCIAAAMAEQWTPFI